MFDQIVDYLISTKGLDIYDRNYGTTMEEYKFPEKYLPYIKGKLSQTALGNVYKEYQLGLNMNSIQQSQSMFARRVFEMLASNMIVIGNYSRGLNNYFGELTVSTDDLVYLKKRLNQITKDTECIHKFRLLGFRKVMQSHLYEDRFAYIIKKVFGKDYSWKFPKVDIIARCENNSEISRIIAMYELQEYENKELWIYANQNDAMSSKKIHIMDFRKHGTAYVHGEQKGYIAVFEPQDYYGTYYLQDLVLNTRHGNYDIIGKDSFYYYGKDKTNYSVGMLYQKCKQINKRRCIVAYSVVQNLTVDVLLRLQNFTGDRVLAVDEFHYCENYPSLDCKKVEDFVIKDQGCSLTSLSQKRINTSVLSGSKTLLSIDVNELKKRIKLTKGLNYQYEPSLCRITSNLEKGCVSYTHLKGTFEVQKYMNSGKIHIQFDFIGDLNTLGVCIFRDASGSKLQPVFTERNHKILKEPPKGAATFTLALRHSGAGELNILGIQILQDGLEMNQKHTILRNNTLVITNRYPQPTALYANMFLHKRMTGYKEEGYLFDVFTLNHSAFNYREFEGIPVIEGDVSDLRQILDTSEVKTVCIHFMNEEIWKVIEHFQKRLRILIWVHGAEIQPWYRRKFLYQTLAEERKAQIVSMHRMRLWKQIFQKSSAYHLKFIIVSNYFRRIIEEDYQFLFTKENCHIISNYIDTDQFSYIPKSDSQRLNIISIRPYASTIYANDLMVATILELSKWEKFNELHFTIIGSGALFQQTVQPIKQFSNVFLREAFIRQDQIACFYHDNGIILIPTRGDTQGVSRDEAMSCGVVPITCNIAAVPEFVESTCGILVAPEDVKAMAQQVKDLYLHAERFQKLSENAAKRVRQQSSKEYTIMKELKLILGNQNDT